MKSTVATYIGNATDNTDITIQSGWGVPDLVIVKRYDGIAGSWTPVIRTSTFVGDLSKTMTATVATSNLIQGFGTDTFQVSGQNQVNRNNNTHAYLAFQDDGITGFSVFSYTGDGGGARTITPGGSFDYSPVVAIVIPEDAENVYWVSDQHTVGESQPYNGAVVTTAITAIASGSISVATALNVNLVKYHVAVWKAGYAQAIPYVGNGSQDYAQTHSLKVVPVYGMTQASDLGTEAAWKVGAELSPVAAPHTGASKINLIDVLSSTIIRVDSDAIVNTAASDYIAVVWGQPLPFTNFDTGVLPRHRRAGLNRGFVNGSAPEEPVMPPGRSSYPDRTPASLVRTRLNSGFEVVARFPPFPPPGEPLPDGASSYPARTPASLVRPPLNTGFVTSSRPAPIPPPIPPFAPPARRRLEIDTNPSDTIDLDPTV